jgi:peptidoglycan/LPS O-acetylase OafA/YrhL
MESESIIQSYVTNTPPDGLLILGGYSFHQGMDMSKAYWAPRFMAVIPEALLEELIYFLFPFLAALEKKIADLPKKGKESRLSVLYHVPALKWIAATGVQDSLQLADDKPRSFLVLWLQRHPTWQLIRSAYVVVKERKVGWVVSCSFY